MRIIENILKKVVLHEAVVLEKEFLSSTVIKIRLQSDDFSKLNIIPGAFLRLGIGIGQDQLSMKDKIRSYSIWDYQPSETTVDLAIATHSNGIGAKWARECQTGDIVYFKVKKGNFLAEDTADSYLMVGDLSALSHLYMVNRNIGKNKQVASIVYSQQKSELFPDIDGSTPLNFYELRQNPSLEIIAKIKEITPTFKSKKMVYIAGDSRVCMTLHTYFRKELGWETKQLKTKPFWNPIKKGLE